jgi:hypothetical protein
MTPRTKRHYTPKGTALVTHVNLTREEHNRLLAIGARLGAPIGVQLSARQVLIYLLSKDEKDNAK